MRVRVLADLPGHSMATTSMYMYTTKLERFDEIRTRKGNFESKFLEMVFQLLEEIFIY